jgi:hypothetical protein
MTLQEALKNLQDSATALRAAQDSYDHAIEACMLAMTNTLGSHAAAFHTNLQTFQDLTSMLQAGLPINVIPRKTVGQ